MPKVVLVGRAGERACVIFVETTLGPPPSAFSDMGNKKAARQRPPAPPKKSWNKCYFFISATLLAFGAYIVRQIWLASLFVPPYVPVDIPANFYDGERPTTVPFQLPPARKIPTHPIQEQDKEKLHAIRVAFQSSWGAYKRNAWGMDEYHPLSKSGTNLLLKDESPVGFTIVDALDTLIILGMEEDYMDARNWIRDELSWDVDGRLNVFETTIRILGGLLSASALMLDPPAGTLRASHEDSIFFLTRAQELAARLLPAFDTPSGIPKREINLHTGESFYDEDNHGSSSLAEVTTIQLEFKYLAERTGDQKYWRIAERPMQAALKTVKEANFGILPIFLSPHDGEFYLSEIRLGSRGDSYYEYLVKQFIQTNRTEQVYRNMYEYAFDDIKAKLLKHTPWLSPPLVHTLEIYPRNRGKEWRAITKQDHLVCFLGGTMMLGASVMVNGTLLPPMQKYGGTRAMREDWRVGHELIRTCVDTYTNSATGLGAEIVFFRSTENATDRRAWVVKQANRQTNPDAGPPIDARNILRPETIESLYIAFQLTGDPIYREWGWQIFESFQHWCQVDGGVGGYAGIDNVDDVNHNQIDRMETFWLSETLKYFYLLFSERNILPFHTWVFNTEAHPLPIFTPSFLTKID